MYGRAISLIAAVATAVLHGATLYRLTRARFAAAIASALFLAVPYVWRWAPFARVDLVALAASWGDRDHRPRRSRSASCVAGRAARVRGDLHQALPDASVPPPYRTAP